MIKLKLCSDIRTTTKNVARQVCFKDCGRNVKGQGEVEGTLNVSIAAENVDASCGVITIGDGQDDWGWSMSEMGAYRYHG